MLSLFATRGFTATRNTNSKLCLLGLYSSLHSIRAAHNGFALLAVMLQRLRDGDIASPTPGKPSSAVGLPWALPCAPALSPCSARFRTSYIE